MLELAQEMGLPVREEAITEQELGQCEEMFLTGTTTDVMPIVSCDGRTVGSGDPGPIAGRLYEALVARDLYLVAGCAAAGALFLALGIVASDVAMALADPRLEAHA